MVRKVPKHSAMTGIPKPLALIKVRGVALTFKQYRLHTLDRSDGRQPRPPEAACDITYLDERRKTCWIRPAKPGKKWDATYIDIKVGTVKERIRAYTTKHPFQIRLAGG